MRIPSLKSLLCTALGASRRAILLAPVVTMVAALSLACAAAGAQEDAATAVEATQSRVEQNGGAAAEQSVGVRLDLVSGQSEARYRAQEVLAGIDLPTEAVGFTRDVTGALVVDAAGAVVAEASKIVVDLRTLRSDESRRDRFLRQNTLQTDAFPTAEFVVRELKGVPSPAPTSESVSFEMAGELTVHGVTRPVLWEGSATIDGQDVTGTAKTQVRMTDFRMPLPIVGFVLSVEDELTLEIDVRGRLDR